MRQPEPKLKDVVALLMKRKEEIYKDVVGRQGTRSNVLHCVYECPRKANCRSGGTIVFEKNRGFSSAYVLLKSFIANGSEQELIKQYYSALKYSCTNGQSSMLDHFRTNLSATTR